MMDWSSRGKGEESSAASSITSRPGCKMPKPKRRRTPSRRHEAAADTSGASSASLARVGSVPR
eukprot:scaffold264494_cov27-Tisochrysis_lutea.AAC.6